jgi:predicted metalloprotease
LIFAAPAGASNDGAADVEADLGAFWSRIFSAAGTAYAPPGVEERADLSWVPGCEANVIPGAVGLYCAETTTIYLDSVHLFPPARLGGGAVWTFVLAHEWGHHIQDQLGWAYKPQVPGSVELQADCLAGAYAGDAAERGVFSDRFLTRLSVVAERGEPGGETVAWYAAGVVGGPAACGVPL